MLSARNEATNEFANAWSEYRNRVAPVTESILVPNILSAMGPLNDETVVDVGCGDGDFLGRLAPLKPAKLIGLDINLFLLQAANKYLSTEVTLVSSDIAAGIGLQDNSASRIFCNNVLMHLDHDEVKSGALEINRILMPGGRAVITIVHLDWALEMYNLQTDPHGNLYCKRPVGETVFKEWYRSGDSYQDIFEKAGFTVRSREDLIIPYNSDLPERYSQRSGKSLYELFLLCT